VLAVRHQDVLHQVGQDLGLRAGAI
jgi:hypothetical protein